MAAPLSVLNLRASHFILEKPVFFSVQNSAQRALQECEKMFGDMMRSIERMQQEMAKLISTNKRAALSNAEGHMERLNHEIADLKRRDSEITQLSRTEDHIHFIQVSMAPETRGMLKLTPISASSVKVMIFFIVRLTTC